MKKLQHQDGYITVTVMLFTISSIVLLTFIMEFGRMVETHSRVENGIELATSAGVHAYGKTFVEEFREEYQKEEEKAAEEIEDERIDKGWSKDSDEYKEKLHEETLNRVKPKVGDIHNRARSSCNSAVTGILNENEIMYESADCTEEYVEVTASREYAPVYDEIALGGSSFTREHREEIEIEID